MTQKHEIEISEMVARMRAKSDNAYCDYIGELRRDECLGSEIKMERGKFGDAELKAHCAAAEKLGRHRALHEAALMLQEFITNCETDLTLLNDGEDKLKLSVDFSHLICVRENQHLHPQP